MTIARQRCDVNLWGANKTSMLTSREHKDGSTHDRRHHCTGMHSAYQHQIEQKNDV